jgi:RNA polymerase sigma factor (sigma-70 family)
MMTAHGHADSREPLDDLMADVRTGDNAAWTRLIARYDRTLRTVARSYRLGSADVDDVVQMAWWRLYQNVGSLRDPRAIGSWLVTTTRREAMRALQRSTREQLSADPTLGDSTDGDRPESAVLAAEQRRILGRALSALPERQRHLLTLLATEPDADYRQISATLAMPVGSIGPVRARGLARLRQDPALRSHHVETV